MDDTHIGSGRGNGTERNGTERFLRVMKSNGQLSVIDSVVKQKSLPPTPKGVPIEMPVNNSDGRQQVNFHLNRTHITHTYEVMEMGPTGPTGCRCFLQTILAYPTNLLMFMFTLLIHSLSLCDGLLIFAQLILPDGNGMHNHG